VVKVRGVERGPKEAAAEKVTEAEGRKATKVGQKKVSFRDEMCEFELAQAGTGFSGAGNGDSVVFPAQLVKAVAPDDRDKAVDGVHSRKREMRRPSHRGNSREERGTKSLMQNPIHSQAQEIEGTPMLPRRD
jgi:hypothetical protein